MSRSLSARSLAAARFALLAIAVALLPLVSSPGGRTGGIDAGSLLARRGHDRPAPFSETHLLPASAGTSGAIVQRSGGKRDDESKTPPPCLAPSRTTEVLRAARASSVRVVRLGVATRHGLSARSTRAPPRRIA